MWFPPDQANKIGKAFVDYLKDNPPDKTVEKNLCIAISSDEEGVLLAYGIGEIMKGKEKEALMRNTQQNLFLASKIDGVRYKTDILLDFTFITSGGKINFPDYWKTDLSLNRIKTKGEVLDNFSLLSLDSLLIDFDGPDISLAGNINLEQSNPNIDVKLLIDNLLVKEIDEYWPYSIEHSTRQWISDHIVDGIINNVEAKIKILPEDYLQKKLPENTIDAIVEFE